MLSPWWTIIDRSAPWWGPTVVVAAFVGAVWGLSMSRRDGRSWLPVALFVTTLGITVGYCLTPAAGSFRDWSVPEGASWRLSDLLPPSALWGMDEISLRMWLFVPLGTAALFLRPRRRCLAAVGVAVSTPVVMEMIQWLLPVLGRGAQLGDVALNLEGVGIGMAVGTALVTIRFVRRRARGPVVDLRGSDHPVKSAAG